MADRPRRRPPGWYPDPDHPGRLRRWSGHGWGDERRIRPLWTLGSAEWMVVPSATTLPSIGSQPDPTDSPEDGADPADERPGPEEPREPVLEGPARSAALTAGWSTTTRGLPPTAPFTGPLLPPGRPARNRRHRTPPGAPGRRVHPDPAGPPPPRGRWPRPRQPVLVVAALAIVAAMVAGSVVGTVGAAEHQRIDATFVTAANTACRSAFASSMTPGPPGRDAQSVRRSADQVDQLATQLANLPIGSWSRPLINEWLFHWHRYADNRRLFAARLGPGSSSNGADSSGPSGAAAAESGAATEAAIADRFAQTSGLTACTLAANRV